MPTPLGHSLAGLTVHFAARGTPVSRRTRLAFGLVVLANLPDIDFLPGYFFGTPNAWHWGPTHSLSAAIIAGCAVAAVARRFGTRFAPAFLVATLAYGSHIFLDLLVGVPVQPSVGLQVLWPFSLERYMLPWDVFLGAPRTGNGPLGLLFSSAVLPLFAREVMILLPGALIAWMFGRKRAALLRPAAETSRARAGS